MAIPTAGVCLIAALVVAPDWQDPARPTAQSAQSTPQATQAQAQAPPAAGSAAAQQPEQTPPERQRPSKKTPRTSKRQLPTSAQGSFEEARTSRDGGPVRQELTITSNMLGGYDDSVTAGLGSGSAVAPTAMASGGTAFLDATLDYFRGNARHSIQLNSTGSLTAYPGYLDDPAPGAAVNVGAVTTLGRDTRFRFSERVGYEPLFNVYSPGASSTPLPPEIGDAVPVTGLFERRSFSSNSAVSVSQRWGRRDWTSLSYSYRTQEFSEDDYGDNTSQEVQAEYRRGISRGVRALVNYGYRNLQYTGSDESQRPAREHRVEGGPEIQKVLSRRRQIMFSLTAGAVRVESVNSTTRQPYADWVPIGSANLSFALSPAWNIDGGYRRDMNTFQGVTDEVYTTGTAFLSTGGPITDRTNLRIGATYGNWKTQVASGVNDTMGVYGAFLQLEVALTNTMSGTASYYYYYHRYSNPGSLPEGFPAEYDRHAVRVGLTFWVRLAGSLQRTQR